MGVTPVYTRDTAAAALRKLLPCQLTPMIGRRGEPHPRLLEASCCVCLTSHLLLRPPCWRANGAWRTAAWGQAKDRPRSCCWGPASSACLRCMACDSWERQILSSQPEAAKPDFVALLSLLQVGDATQPRCVEATTRA